MIEPTLAIPALAPSSTCKAMTFTCGGKKLAACRMPVSSPSDPVAMTTTEMSGDNLANSRAESDRVTPSSSAREKTSKAIGGSGKLAKVKTLRKVYTAEMGGMTVELSEQFAAPHMYAMTMGSGPMVMQRLVYDGVRGKKSGMDGEDELVDLELEDAKQSSVPFPEIAYKELDYGAMLNGVVEIDGRKCNRILVKKAAGGAFTEYYDAETGLKVRRMEAQATGQGTMQVTTDFKDYKEVDGILFPHVIEQNMGQHIVFSATVIEVDRNISPAVFAITD